MFFAVSSISIPACELEEFSHSYIHSHCTTNVTLPWRVDIRFSVPLFPSRAGAGSRNIELYLVVHILLLSLSLSLSGGRERTRIVSIACQASAADTIVSRISEIFMFLNKLFPHRLAIRVSNLYTHTWDYMCVRART